MSRRDQVKQIARRLFSACPEGKPAETDIDLFGDVLIDAAVEQAGGGVDPFTTRSWADMPLYLKIDEVARLARSSTRTIMRRVEDGELVGHKPNNEWLFHRDTVQAWIEQEAGSDN